MRLMVSYWKLYNCGPSKRDWASRDGLNKGDSLDPVYLVALFNGKSGPNKRSSCIFLASCLTWVSVAAGELLDFPKSALKSPGTAGHRHFVQDSGNVQANSCAVLAPTLLYVLYGIQLKRVCIQTSWIPHCVTQLWWDNFAIGITVCVSCYLARKRNSCFHSEHFLRVYLISDLFYCCLSFAHLQDSAFFLPINNNAEQVDVFMKRMWHLSRWLRVEAESLNFWYSVSIFSVVAVCISQLAHDWVTGSAGNWNWGSPLSSEVVSQHTWMWYSHF